MVRMFFWAVVLVSVFGLGFLLWLGAEVPFSSHTRAWRARARGRVGESLRWFAESGDLEEIRDILFAGGNFSYEIACLLQRGIRELIDLRTILSGGPIAGLSGTRRRRLVDGVTAAGEVVWESADRLATAYRLGRDLDLDESASYAATRLTRVVEDISSIRRALARLVLSDEDLLDLIEMEDSLLRLENDAEVMKEAA